MKLTEHNTKYDKLFYLSVFVVSIFMTAFYNQAVGVVGLFMLVILVFITFARVELAIIISLVWPYFQYFFVNDIKILPNYFTLIDECCLISIFIYMAWSLFNNKIHFTFCYFDVFLISFMFIGIVSAVLNNNPVLNTILGLRCYIQYIILYYAISYLDISDKFCRLLINSMLALVIIQVPITVYQYFTWTSSSLVNDHADAAYGTFSYGAANILGMLMLVFVFYMLKMSFFYNSIVRYLFLTLVGFCMVLSHSKMSYILLFIVLIYDGVKNIYYRINYKKIIYASIGVFVLLKLAFWVSNDIANLFSYENLMVLINNQLEDKEGGGRIMSLLLTFSILYKYAFSPFLGLGPGMYTSYAGISLKSHYLVDILNVDLEHRGARLDPDVIGVLGEYGYLGFLFFALMLFVLLFRKIDILNVNCSKYWAHYFQWVKLFTLIFFLGAFVNGLWQAQFFAVTYWVAAGILNKKYLESIQYESNTYYSRKE